MRTILSFMLAGICSAGLIACGDSSSGSSSRTGFGSSSGGSSGSGGGTSSGGSNGTTAVGSGSQSGDQHGAGPGDPSTNVDPGQTNNPDPNAPCNDFPNGATGITVQNTSQSMPTGTGGAPPLDGYYSLTQAQHYGFSSQTTSYKGTMFISAGIYGLVMSKNGTETRATYSATYDTTSSTLTLTGVCGDSNTVSYSYTSVTETQIILYDATNKIAYTYTRPDPAEVDGGL